MASTLLEVPEFLEELKSKRLKVAELEAEITRLHVLLIEKDSELNCRSLQSSSLEVKFQRIQYESSQMIAELQRRLKVSQEENHRLVSDAGAVEEKCRRNIMEKKIMELKITSLEAAVQEKEKQSLTLMQTLKEIQCRQEKIAKVIDEKSKKQEEMVELCQSTTVSAAERRHEAEQYAKMVQKVKDKLQETEMKLHNANARIQVLEKGLNVQPLAYKHDQVEALTLQLKTVFRKLKAQQREAQLRNDLRTEREERLKMERKVDEVFQNFVGHLTRGENLYPSPKQDHSSLMTENNQEMRD